VDPNQGINALSKEEREDAYDTNYKEPPQPTPFCDFIFECLQDIMLRILLVCSAIALIADMIKAKPGEHATAWIESFAMFAAVAVVCLFTAWQDSSKEA